MNDQAGLASASASGVAGYRAFISYSHADARFAARLHRWLETYRLPRRLVDQHLADTAEPGHLRPIFRDRDELSAAGQLSDVLQDVLARSRFLIVILSANAARSTWVAEEVRQFKMMGRADRILAIVAPDAQGPVPGLMPATLAHAVDAQGRLLERMQEPIAADARKDGDGLRLARLKLVGGLTGLPLDALVQRDAARRQLRARLVATAATAVAIVMTVLAVLAIRGQAEAERQRAQADGLIQFMLTDLRRKLEPVGRLEVLDSVGQRALAYYGAQDVARLDPDELGRRTRALLMVAEVRELRGDSETALTAYREAERTTAELLARAPDDPNRIFDHAQSVFYVGQTAWNRNDWKTAEARFRDYVDLADRLAAREPGRRAIAEQGYAANSLGVAFLRQRRSAEAAVEFERYRAAAQKLAALDPSDPRYRMDLAQAEAWLADAHAASNDLAAARAGRSREIAIYAGILAEDPRHADARLSQVMALSTVAALDLAEGEVAAALDNSQLALVGGQALLAEDRTNSMWRDFLAHAANGRAEALMAAGRWTDARAANRLALAESAALVAADPRNHGWRVGRLMVARWMELAIARALDGKDAASRLDAGFRRDFAATRAQDVAAGSGTAWMMVEAMAARDSAARGAQEDAARHRVAAVQAAQMASGVAAARAHAALAVIGAPVPGGAAGAAAYPAAAILSPRR